MGGDTKIEQPSPPAAPSGAEAIREWANILPQIYQTQAQYEPQLMEQQLGLQEKYASSLLDQYLTGQQQFAPEMMRQEFELQKEYMPEMARLGADISAELYPETVGLQEDLATQAREGMTGEAPDWYMDKYSDYTKSLLGSQIASPMGTGDYARGMLEQQKGWQDYYRNLGLSVTGRQPLQQPTPANVPQYNMPQYQGTGWTQGTNPMGTWGMMNQGYGSYSNLYGNMYNTNAGMAQMNAARPFQYMQGAGNLMTSIGGLPWGGGGIL